MCKVNIYMPKGEVNVWEFEETMPILEFLMSIHPYSARRKDIENYLKLRGFESIYPALMTRRLKRLEKEKLIKKEKKGLYKLNERQYPFIFRKVSIEAQNKFYPRQFIPITHYDLLKLTLGLNPNFMDEELWKKLDELERKINDCMKLLSEMKQYQIELFIKNYLLNLDVNEDIKALFKKYFQQIREEILRVYVEDKPTISDKLLLSPDFARLSEDKKQVVVTSLKKCVKALKEHFPAKKHGMVAIHPDPFFLSETLIVVAGFPEMSLLWEKAENRDMEIIDALIKDNVSGKSIARKLEEIIESIANFIERGELPETPEERIYAFIMREYPSIREKLKKLHEMRRIVNCPACGRMLFPHRIAGKKDARRDRKVMIPFLKEVEYEYKCECSKKALKRKFVEIDFETIRKYICERLDRFYQNIEKGWLSKAEGKKRIEVIKKYLLFKEEKIETLQKLARIKVCENCGREIEGKKINGKAVKDIPFLKEVEYRYRCKYCRWQPTTQGGKMKFKEIDFTKIKEGKENGNKAVAL